MVYCSTSIRRFATHNGWWYRACPSCYKQLKEKENSNEFVCVQHGIQTALPCYRVYMTIDDADNQATVMLMGRQAEQFFGSSCQDLVNKRSYPTEKTLPEEIAKTIGQNQPFSNQSESRW
ncbi:hypothetical protein ABKV19_008843 [Rosa sericea]